MAYHVRTLKAAGVVVLADEARVRGSVEHLYALAPTAEKVTLNDPSEAMLSLCGVLMLPGGDEGLPRPVVLDDEARLELRVLLDALTPKVHTIARKSTERVSS